jgi:hypothetical protein
MAKLAVRHGRRRADESRWQRRVFDAIRFLARRKRRRRAILSRAKLLLQAQNEKKTGRRAAEGHLAMKAEAVTQSA